MPLKCSPLVLIGALAAGALVSPLAASAAQAGSEINLTLSSATKNVATASHAVRIAALNFIELNSHDHDNDYNNGHNHDHVNVMEAQRSTEGSFTA